MQYGLNLVEPTNLKRQSYTRIAMMMVNKVKKRTSLDPPCPICLNTISDRNCTVTNCGHSFHLDCICRHIFLSASGKRCPICRAALPDVRDTHSRPAYPPSIGRPTQFHTHGPQAPIRGTLHEAALLQVQRRRPMLNTIIERRMRGGPRPPQIRRGHDENDKIRKMRRLKRMLESNVSY